MHLRFILFNPKITFAFLLSNFLLVSAQKDSNIQSAFKGYTEAPREVVYVHLNKSTYIKGEDIGFTAYVFDKQSKMPAVNTTNLYVTIEDQNKESVKKVLLKVENGVASNVFPIDSTFASGHYRLKAYTNWMRNFNEQGSHIESIKIMDQNINHTLTPEPTRKNINAQFFPEGGHLLNNILNNVGVVLKDSRGFGIAHAKGKVFDKDNQLLTEFQVNHLGIGRFLLNARTNTSYTVKIYDSKKEYSFKLNKNVEPIGVTLSVVKHRNKAIVALVTNAESLAQIKDKPYTLALHNGKKIDIVDVVFDSETTVLKAFELSTLPPGMNIFTLFNEHNQPIVERLFFNYQGLDIIKSQGIIAKRSNDSIEVKLNYKQVNPKTFNNLSISVLPRETISYSSHQNIISQTFLQPYVKGFIEQANYYFTEINEEKKIELDKLLITQGWSSYDWNNIFIGKPRLSHNFERGIHIKANFNSKEINENGKPNYLMYSLNDEGFRISEADHGATNYWIESLFPEENNEINLSKVSEDSNLDPPSLYLQFFPRRIPELFRSNLNVLEIKSPKQDLNDQGTYTSNVMLKPTKNIEKLDEVTVVSKLSPTMQRQNELSSGRFGRVTVVDRQLENSYLFLSHFLASRGLVVASDSYFDGLRVFFPGSITGGEAALFLDDVLLMDKGLLAKYMLYNIDYIEINRFGLGNGMLTPNGFIKVYTKDPTHERFQRKTTNSYEFPLTFTSQKTFYTPVYRYYNDDFYKHYGTIDWKPNLKVDANGFVSFKIEKPEVPVTFFIEGIANDGAFIFEEKTVSLN